MKNNEEIIQEWIENIPFHELSNGQKVWVTEHIHESEYIAMRQLHLTATSAGKTKNLQSYIATDSRKSQILAAAQANQKNSKSKTLVLSWITPRGLYRTAMLLTACVAVFILVQKQNHLPIKNSVTVVHDTLYLPAVVQKPVYTNYETNNQKAVINKSLISTKRASKKIIYPPAPKLTTEPGSEMITTIKEHERLGLQGPGQSNAENTWVQKFGFEKLLH